MRWFCFRFWPIVPGPAVGYSSPRPIVTIRRRVSGWHSMPRNSPPMGRRIRRMSRVRTFTSGRLFVGSGVVSSGVTTSRLGARARRFDLTANGSDRFVLVPRRTAPGAMRTGRGRCPLILGTTRTGWAGCRRRLGIRGRLSIAAAGTQAPEIPGRVGRSPFPMAVRVGPGDILVAECHRGLVGCKGRFLLGRAMCRRASRVSTATPPNPAAMPVVLRLSSRDSSVRCVAVATLARVSWKVFQER